MNILTFYSRRVSGALFVFLRDYSSTENFHGDDLVIGSIIAARGVSRYKERSRDPERSCALLHPDCFIPVLLSARSLKITKVDCRQESAGSIIEFPIPIYLCRATMRPSTKRRREGGRKTHHSLCRASCEAAQLLHGSNGNERVSSSPPDGSPRGDSTENTENVSHPPRSQDAGVFEGHLMENSSGRASQNGSSLRLPNRRVYFPSRRPEGKSPVVRDRPSFKGHARGEGNDGRSRIRGRK